MGLDGGRRGAGWRGAVAAGLVATAVVACQGGSSGSSGSSGQPLPETTTSLPATTPVPSATPATPTPTAPATPSLERDTNGATAAPSWLGTRVLPIGPDGYGQAAATPKELRDRRIITTDVLAPPADGRFRARIAAVSAAVAKRSTWSAGCPVTLQQLRYVTVTFRGFDGRPHTGELLVNRSVAGDVVTAFRALFTAGWPIEEMRITSRAELSAPPTGDGNNTGAFACRPVRGATSWSQHAYGLAIDVDPFDNPYVSGRTVLPELAKAYVDRGRGWPGIITPSSKAVAAFRSIGWSWGGDYRTTKDWMHFSSTGT